MSVRLWAPPNLSRSCIKEKVEEWIRLHPNTPPYERFLQDYISSQWPVLWHLKREFVVNLLGDNESECSEEEPICAICRCPLDLGCETVSCNHRFHTMCIHRWLRRSATCPICRTTL